MQRFLWFSWFLWSSAVSTSQTLWSLTREIGNEKWAVAGWGLGDECVHHPWQAPARPSDPLLPLGHSVLRFPDCRGGGAPRVHSADTERDVIGRDRKYKLHGERWTGSAREGAGSTSQKRNRSCAQHARCAKTPDLLSGRCARFRQWNKLGLTGVRQSGCSRQNPAGSTRHPLSLLYALSTSIPLAIHSPEAVSPTSSLCVCVCVCLSIIYHC